MVFFEVDSIFDVKNGQRIIIYYIKGESNYICKNYMKLFKNTESALEQLGKKNDDLLLIEIPYNSNQFRQFVNLYMPQINAPITLFAVNNEGIPLISVNICDEGNMYTSIERICTTCNLNNIPNFGQQFVENNRTGTIQEPVLIDDMEKLSTTTLSVESSSSTLNIENKQAVSQENNSTRLHIRMPNGAREEVQFDNDATLQEVWVVISTRFKIKDFDLKTYNHPIFSDVDYDQTLQQLDLCPRGVLIVVNKNVIPFNNNGGIRAIIQSGFLRLFTSSSFAFQYIQGILYTFWNYLFPSINSSASRRQGNKEIKPSSDPSNGSQSRSSARKYVSRNTNVHTLHRSDESDDENNRYNGNSTQQK